MKCFTQRRVWRPLTTCSAAIVCAAVLTGCGASGPTESESKMTSYSTNENKNDTASLFTVPQDQMAHLKIVAVDKSHLPRVLRLTGAVAYNAFATTPVFSAIGGPVQISWMRLICPGNIQARLAIATQSRLFRGAFRVSQIQERVSPFRQKLSALQGSLRT